VADDRAAFESSLRDALAKTLDGFRELVSCERLSGGASQETYRIVAATADGEQRLAMRRTPGGLPTESGKLGRIPIGTEALLMRCAREAGVPEPQVLRVLEPSDGLGEGFLMEWIEGETLGSRIVRSDALRDVRPRLARQCGEILARIHAIDLDATGLVHELRTQDPRAFVEKTRDAYRRLSTPQPMIDFTARWLLDHLPAAPRRTLVHNDFRNGNLMVSQDGVVAVLDWEIAHIGDPMRDLGWICTNSWRFGRRDLEVGGFGSSEDLFAGYESVSGTKVNPDHVRFWEVFGSFWWAVGCLDMAHQFRTGPDRSVERAAIGRRTSECQVDCVNLLIPGPVECIVAESFTSTLDLPRIDELALGARDLLRDDVMAASHGRLQFLARVAANALDIVLRELAIGPEHRRRERERLCALLGDDDELEPLRWRLVEALRDGSMPLHNPDLAAHLRATVVNQAAIDQPRYSGFRAAVGED
jgi:aminoglycoside phosphotransferase (APT) family kinase protein